MAFKVSSMHQELATQVSSVMAFSLWIIEHLADMPLQRRLTEIV